MKNQYDIIVIGAGIAGASVAAELAREARVLLLEAEARPGVHATGRSAAYYAPSYGNDLVRQLTRDSEPYFRDTDHEVPLIKDRSALFIATDEQMQLLSDMHAEQPALRKLDSKAVREWVPALKADRVVAGLLDTVGGDLDVDAILQTYLKAFKARGGHMQSSIAVESLEFSQDLWAVRGKSFAASAPTVVNAAGAWSDQVAGLAGLAPIGLQPKRRTAVLVDGLAEWANWPLTIDIEEQFYFKPDAGQLLISPADETPSDPCDAQPDEFDIAVAVDRVQQIADIPVSRINHKWAGLRTFAPDKSFVIGFDPRAKGFFWCAGQGGYGVQSAAGVANISAQLCLEASLDARSTKLALQLAPDRLL